MRDDLPTAIDGPDLLSRGPVAKPRAPWNRLGLGIRQKVFCLVLFSALVPAFVVGTVSYFSARGLLIEKVHTDLAARLAMAKASVERALEERETATEVFANAFVVSRALEVPVGETAVRRAQELANLQRYLDEVSERYPLYRELVVLDRHLETLARSPEVGAGLGDLGYHRAGAESSVRLGRGRGVTFVEVRRPILTAADQRVGRFVAVGLLDDLWGELSGSVTASEERLILVGANGDTLFDSAASAGPTRDIGAEIGIAEDLGAGSALVEHVDSDGRWLLSGYDVLPAHQLGMVLEVNAGTAFAAVSELRTIVIVISVSAALLVAALGFLLATDLTRPIGDLIEGARVVAEGDLSSDVTVSSADEIGELTTRFNLMVRSLRLSQERLEVLSVTDELTGLYNRRYLTRVLEKELQRSKRSGRPFAVIMIDLDRFKAFNDDKGHYEGDSFLKTAAGILESEFRPSDVVARYGGEEFVVLLPDAGKAQAGAIAERVRLRFAELAREAEDSPRVTISAGVASYPEDGLTRTELMVNADMALYQAKRLGRNRVELCRAA